MTQGPNPLGFKNRAGVILAWNEWHTVGRVDIRPALRRPWFIRLTRLPNYTHMVTRATPSGREAVMLALYNGVEPTAFARFCFGRDLEDV